MTANKERAISHAELKTMIEASDMNQKEQEHVCAFVGQEVLHGGEEGPMAERIKKRADKELSPSGWHCMVGRDFGAWVTHRPGSFIFLYCAKKCVLLFRTP